MTRALEKLPQFAEIRQPRAVIPNGIRVPANPVPVPSNPRPVVGYSVGYQAPWQGLDRLAELADALPEFDFHLVVPDPAIAAEVSGSRVQVFVAGSPAEYRTLISRFDVALGGLALDRKGIEVASALKVRESVSLGIPTILFSTDEDLEGVDTPTIRTLANGAWAPQDLVPSVREFVSDAHGARIPDAFRQRVDIEEKAREYARLVQAALDWSVSPDPQPQTRQR